MLDAICTFSFDERLVMNCVNTLYEARYSNYVGICPKTAPSNNNNNNRRLVTLAVKVILFANIIIGPAYPGLFASNIISTFIVM